MHVISDADLVLIQGRICHSFGLLIHEQIIAEAVGFETREAQKLLVSTDLVELIRIHNQAPKDCGLRERAFLKIVNSGKEWSSYGDQLQPADIEPVTRILITRSDRFRLLAKGFRTHGFIKFLALTREENRLKRTFLDTPASKRHRILAEMIEIL